MRRLALALVVAVSPAEARAATVDPIVEASAGFGTPVGSIGALGGVAFGRRFVLAAGIGWSPGGVQIGGYGEAFPFVLRRVSFGLRSSLGVGNVTMTNCSTPECTQTLHEERRWEVRYRPAVFAGLAAVMRVQLGRGIELGFHLGFARLLDVDAGTCVYDVNGENCAAARRTGALYIADLGLAATFRF